MLSAELLGFEGPIPPYAEVSGQEILKGVNYASAAAGIREETGQQLVLNSTFVSAKPKYSPTLLLYNFFSALLVLKMRHSRPNVHFWSSFA